MGKTVNRRSAEFKFRVVLESIQQNRVAEVARRYRVNPNQLTNWRQEFMRQGPKLFDSQEGKQLVELKRGLAQLESLIGKKEIELSVLKDYLDFYVPPDGR